MNRISLIQVSGPSGCGGFPLLQRLGLGGLAADTINPGGPASTILKAGILLEELAAGGAGRDHVNDLLVWTSGWVDLFAEDIKCGYLLGQKGIAAVFKASQLLMEPHGRQVILVADSPVTMPTDPTLLKAVEEERERYRTATSVLAQLGAEVHRFRTFEEAAPAVLLRSFFRDGEVAGFGHQVNKAGVIRLGER
jgi:hypothetical protein